MDGMKVLSKSIGEWGEQKLTHAGIRAAKLCYFIWSWELMVFGGPCSTEYKGD